MNVHSPRTDNAMEPDSCKDKNKHHNIETQKHDGDYDGQERGTTKKPLRLNLSNCSKEW